MAALIPDKKRAYDGLVNEAIDYSEKQRTQKNKNKKNEEKYCEKLTIFICNL